MYKLKNITLFLIKPFKVFLINIFKNESYFFNSLVDHKELTHTIWGDEIKQDNFERWSQGFIFDSKEPTALLQFNGGPCAVIAAVQAFLLKELIFSSSDNWRKPNGILKLTI